MAKKQVYKNKLQRDQEVRKQRRADRMKGNTKGNAKARKGIESKEKAFLDLKGMSDAQIEAKLQSILKQRELIEKEIAGRSNRGERDGEVIENLMSRDRALEREQKRLEAFPEVKSQIEKVMSIRDRVTKTKATKMKTLRTDIGTAKTELAAVKAKRKEEVARQQAIADIDKELKEIEAYREELKSKDLAEIAGEKDKIEENSKKYAELTGKKKELEEQSVDINKETARLEEKIESMRAQLGDFESGKSTEDSMINKCNMAWMMLLEGKSWEEIEIKAVEDLDWKKPEPTPERAPEPEPTPKPAPAPAPNPEPAKPDEDLDYDEPEDLRLWEKIPIVKNIGRAIERRREESLYPLEQKRFAEKHPRIAALPFSIGDRIAKFADRKIDEAEKMEAIRLASKNPWDREPEPAPKPEPAPAPEKDPEPTPAPASKPEPEKAPEPSKETKRDMFIEYLRETATTGVHTESGKYASKSAEREAEEEER